jgi:hypothetical protein
VPLIYVTCPVGALTREARAALLRELAKRVLHREALPDTDFFRSIEWVHVRETATCSTRPACSS